MKQLSFFDPPRRLPVRRTDPPESHEAAARINTRGLEALVFEALRERGAAGATTHELADALRLQLVTVSPRMAPLQRAGLVYRTGARRDGRGVWAAAEFRKAEGNAN